MTVYANCDSQKSIEKFCMYNVNKIEMNEETRSYIHNTIHSLYPSKFINLIEQADITINNKVGDLILIGTTSTI